ncbi:MAG TPA: hypothetical protein VIH33_05125, partial [Candidatus Limnocylindria bacterium]
AAQQVTLAPLWVPLFVCLMIGMGVLLLAIVVTRDVGRGGLLATLVLVLFFSFGHLWNLVGAPMDASRWVMAAGYVMIGVGLGLLIGRGGRWVPHLNQFLNVVAVLLLAFNTLQVANYASASVAAAVPEPTPSGVTLHDPSVKPDIYYIILDRYANSDTLSQIYEFDNEPFLRELEARGFSIARHAWANYFKTALSLYSSLNMSYIDPERLGVDMSKPSTFSEVQAGLRDHLAAPSALRSIGYDYVHLGGWWEPTATNVDADVSVRYQGSTEFLSAVWATTAMSLFWPPVYGGTGPDGETMPFTELARDGALFSFDALEDTAQRPGPTFAFAHILLPHPPYVFNADGSFPSAYTVSHRAERISYVEQLQWTNQRVLQAVDHLMAHGPDEPDPVIILQADEGPFPAAFQANERGFQWLDASPREIQQKFGILNAVRLPGVDPATFGFNDESSPVNQFRMVFNAYFGADLPLLPNETFLSPDYARMWDFVRYPHPDY